MTVKTGPAKTGPAGPLATAMIRPANSKELCHWVEAVVSKAYGKYLPEWCYYTGVLHLDSMLNTHTMMFSMSLHLAHA